MCRKILYFCVFYGAIIYHSQAAKESLKGEQNKIVDDEVKLVQHPDVLHTEKNNLEKPPQKGHILFFHNAGTRSHLIAMTALVEGLVEQGHLVTSVFYAKSNIKNKNYKEILVEDRYVGTDLVFT